MKREEFMDIIGKNAALQTLNDFKEYRYEMKTHLPESKDDIDAMFDLIEKIFADNVNDMKKLIDTIPFED